VVVRTYYALGNRLREQRFMRDVVGTLLYLSTSLAIITDVFDIPLKGVLATSGALAIVLGLALQSTLSDLFSGLLINATAPYRVDDTISLDSSTEGRVVEITWRATHLARANRRPAPRRRFPTIPSSSATTCRRPMGRRRYFEASTW
jgi:small-conductance mechanosensitive channel